MEASIKTFAILLLGLSVVSAKPENDAPVKVTNTENGVRVTCDAGEIVLELLDSNILRVDVRPDNKTSPRTLVMDPSLKLPAPAGMTVRYEGELVVIRSAWMTVSVTRSLPVKIAVADGKKRSRPTQSSRSAGQSLGLGACRFSTVS